MLWRVAFDHCMVALLWNPTGNCTLRFFFFFLIKKLLAYLIHDTISFRYTAKRVSLSHTHTHTHTHTFLLRFFFIIGYCKILSLIPCAPRVGLCCSSLLGLPVCVSVHPQFMGVSLQPPSPWVSAGLFTLSVGLFLFCRSVPYYM